MTFTPCKFCDSDHISTTIHEFSYYLGFIIGNLPHGLDTRSYFGYYDENIPEPESFRVDNIGKEKLHEY